MIIDYQNSLKRELNKINTDESQDPTRTEEIIKTEEMRKTES